MSDNNISPQTPRRRRRQTENEPIRKSIDYGAKAPKTTDQSEVRRIQSSRIPDIHENGNYKKQKPRNPQKRNTGFLVALIAVLVVMIVFVLGWIVFSRQVDEVARQIWPTPTAMLDPSITLVSTLTPSPTLATVSTPASTIISAQDVIMNDGLKTFSYEEVSKNVDAISYGEYGAINGVITKIQEQEDGYAEYLLKDGTNTWFVVFEPEDDDVEFKINDEVRFNGIVAGAVSLSSGTYIQFRSGSAKKIVEVIPTSATTSKSASNDGDTSSTGNSTEYIELAIEKIKHLPINLYLISSVIPEEFHNLSDEEPWLSYIDMTTMGDGSIKRGGEAVLTFWIKAKTKMVLYGNSNDIKHFINILHNIMIITGHMPKKMVFIDDYDSNIRYSYEDNIWKDNKVPEWLEINSIYGNIDQKHWDLFINSITEAYTGFSVNGEVRLLMSPDMVSNILEGQIEHNTEIRAIDYNYPHKIITNLPYEVYKAKDVAFGNYIASSVQYIFFNDELVQCCFCFHGDYDDIEEVLYKKYGSTDNSDESGKTFGKIDTGLFRYACISKKDHYSERDCETYDNELVLINHYSEYNYNYIVFTLCTDKQGNQRDIKYYWGKNAVPL